MFRKRIRDHAENLKKEEIGKRCVPTVTLEGWKEMIPKQNKNRWDALLDRCYDAEKDYSKGCSKKDWIGEDITNIIADMYQFDWCEFGSMTPQDDVWVPKIAWGRSRPCGNSDGGFLAWRLKDDDKPEVTETKTAALWESLKKLDKEWNCSAGENPIEGRSWRDVCYIYNGDGEHCMWLVDPTGKGMNGQLGFNEVDIFPKKVKKPMPKGTVPEEIDQLNPLQPPAGGPAGDVTDPFVLTSP